MSCKKECTACPFNYGHPDCDEAYNLGCLPSAGEIIEKKRETGDNWACHSDPTKICAGMVGFSKEEKLDLDFKSGKLLTEEGVHFSSPIKNSRSGPV